MEVLLGIGGGAEVAAEPLVVLDAALEGARPLEELGDRGRRRGRRGSGRVTPGHDARDGVGVEGAVAVGVAQRLSHAQHANLVGELQDEAHMVAGGGALALA